MKTTRSVSVLLALLLALTLSVSASLLPVSAAAGDNLAANAVVTATPHLGADQKPDGYNTDLTDGVVATSFNWADGQWFGWNWSNNLDQAGNAIVVLDLTKSAKIGKVRVHVIFNDGTLGGVANPKDVKVETSADNADWKVGAEESYEKSTSSDADIKWLEFDMKNVDARYVRLTMSLHQSFVMVDEIEVIEGSDAGSTVPSQDSEAESPADSTPSDAGSSNDSTSTGPAAGDTGLVLLVLLAAGSVAATVVLVRRFN